MKNYDEYRNEKERQAAESQQQNREGEVLPFRGTEQQADTSLLAETEIEGIRARWQEVQTMFVDDPRKAVDSADKLVDHASRRLLEGFNQQRTKLQEQWSRDDKVSTEDLRQALQRYRSFFERLVSI